MVDEEDYEMMHEALKQAREDGYLDEREFEKLQSKLHDWFSWYNTGGMLDQ